MDYFTSFNGHSFKVSLRALMEEESDGKWDWSIKVESIPDGRIKTELVSGGLGIAQHYVIKLRNELLQGGI